MSRLTMTPFQRKAHKLLSRHGWEYARTTGNGKRIYTKPDHEQQVVSCTPKNPGDALKAVQKYAGIKREGQRG